MKRKALSKYWCTPKPTRFWAPAIVGVGGDEAIHCIITAMYAQQTAAFMRRSVFIHPTVSELIPTVFGELKPLDKPADKAKHLVAWSSCQIIARLFGR